MPRTPTTTPETAADDWGVTVNSADAPEEIEETAQDRVALMLRDIRDSQGSKVRLYNKNAQTRKLSWCADYTPEEFEANGFDAIRTTWGAGLYEIRVYGLNGAGNFGVIGRADVEIKASLIPFAQPQQSQSGVSELAQILARVTEQQSAQNAAILEALKQRPDSMASMRDTLALMTSMREAMGLSGNAQPQKSSISEIIEAIKELKGAQELIAPEAPAVDPDNPMSMLPQIVELVKMTMKQKSEALQSAPMPVIVPPASLATSDPQAHQQAITDHAADQEASNNQKDQEMAYAELRASFATLVDMAVKNSPTEEAAEFIYTNLPDELIAPLRDAQWFDLLKMVASEIEPHREYLTKARDAALVIFDNPEV